MAHSAAPAHALDTRGAAATQVRRGTHVIRIDPVAGCVVTPQTGCVMATPGWTRHMAAHNPADVQHVGTCIRLSGPRHGMMISLCMRLPMLLCAAGLLVAGLTTAAQEVTAMAAGTETAPTAARCALICKAVVGLPALASKSVLHMLYACLLLSLTADLQGLPLHAMKFLGSS